MRQKRILSWFLTLCLLLGMFSFPAYAEGNTTTISGDGTAEKTGTMTITLVIPKKTPAATDLTYTAPSDLAYSGSDKAATVAAASGVTGLGTITVKYYSDASRSTEVTETKNVGTYYVGATVAEGDQYAASTAVLYGDGWTFTITASTPSAPAAPTKASATKNSITLTAVDGCEYSMDGTSWQNGTEFTGLLPSTEYTFYQRIKATANTNASPASSATISTAADTYAMTITLVITDKDTQTITAENVTATYGDTNAKVSASTNGNGAISYAVKSGSEDYIDVNATTGALTIKKAGTATVTVTAAETATYAQATKDVTVTVNPKTMTVSAENVTVTVDGQPHSISVNVTDPASGYTVKYGTEAGTYDLDASPTQTEVGTLTVYYQVTADNYETYTGSAMVTVNSHTHNWRYTASGATITATCANTDGGHEGELTATLTVAAPEHSVYGDGKSAEATITGSIDGVATPAIVYKQGETTLTAAPTGAGSYTASITLGTATASVSYTIEGIAQDAPALTVTQQPATPYVTGSIDTKTGETVSTERLQVSADGGKTWTDVTALPYAAKPGTYQFKYKGDANHNESAVTKKLLVEPENELREVKITSDQTDANLYKDGVTNTLTAVTNPNVAGLTLEYKWYREGVEAAVGTGSTYVLQAADVDKKLTVIVTDKTAGAAEPYTTASTATPVIVTVLPDTYEITGKVTVPKTESGTEYDNVANADVELRQGNTVFATAKTDANGDYSFRSVPNGEYNIVVTSGDKTKTEYVKIESGNQIVNVVMPYYDVSSKLVVSGETPAAVVAGLDDEAAKAGKAGQSVTMTMEIESTDDLTDTPDDQLTDEQKEAKKEQQAIKDANTGDDASENLDFIDMSVYKRTQKDGEGAQVEDVHDLNTVLEILLPYTTLNRLFNIFRYHGSAATAFTRLDSRPTSFTDGTFYVGEGYIAVYGSEFSTYAIGYSEVYTVTVTNDGHGTGKATPASGATGTKVTLSYTANSGYHFKQWQVVEAGGGTLSGNTFTIGTANATVKAIFEKDSTPYYPPYRPSDDPTPTTYPVQTEKAEHGTVKTSYEKTSSGTKVTITATPDAGYEVGAVTVTDAAGNTVRVTKNADGTYSFTMPASKVTVTVTFVPIAASADICDPFWDIDKGAWYHTGVHYALEHGIMSGMGDGQFAPNGTTTRAQLATILWNMEGRPVVNYLMDYADVNAGDWYAEAVRWASAQGIIGGYGDGRFGPNDAVTREQLVTILYRYAKLKGVAVSPDANIMDYDDVFDVSDWAVEAMRWAVQVGIIDGVGGNRLAPKDSATRAQIATIIMRYCENVAK